MQDVHQDILAAMMAFGRFVNAALDQWFVQAAAERGASFNVMRR
jgi:hypothetical protein